MKEIHVETLSHEFNTALSLIGLGDMQERAMDAHAEVRAVLEADDDLAANGVDTILIGSYGRETAIYPGRDVDVFVKLPNCDEGPDETYEMVRKALETEYGKRLDDSGSRSMKIKYPDDFWVDAVPAVPSEGGRWQIPQANENGDRTGWEETDPEELGRLTVERNKELKVDGQGAYVPTVKLVRQTRRHHLGDRKPRGLYLELQTYWAFDEGVTGTSFADIFAATLGRIATQLESGVVINDPAIARKYSPAPESADLEHAATIFRDLATKATLALAADRCEAARLWREVLGKNDRNWVFPIPAGCDEFGKKAATITPIADRGSREARPFA
jgi:hypothetical protein